MRNTNGQKVAKVSQEVYTKTPSFQGMFDDFLSVESIQVKHVPN